MEKEKELHFDFPPGKPCEELVAGLQEAIEATKKNISELETHLKSLEQRLEAARKK